MNDGLYNIFFWWQSTSDWGATAHFNAYSGEKSTTVIFTQLSGKITEIQILDASYQNTQDQFDFNHR